MPADNPTHDGRDVDFSEDALHHTLGLNRGQALPGDVLSSITFTGTAPATPFLQQVLAALVALGATDGTT